MAKYIEETWLEPRTCGECGILFAAPVSFWSERRKTRETWYCPNGHPRVFVGPTEADRLKDDLTRAQQKLDAANARAATAERDRSRIAKAHRQMRTRIAGGVCPCCNRSFANLREHMHSQHPTFASDRGLLALRQAFSMTQADVASEAGVGTFHVSLYERAKPVAEYAKRRLDTWVETYGVKEQA